ncbi:unnamed protein product, partial [Discosporangium mesarthrocarpum]
VLQVDEDDEPPDLRRILDRARKERLLELQARAAEEGDDEEGGAALQGAEQRRILQLSLVACTSREYIATVVGNELEPEVDENPMLSMLETEAAFILDVYTEVFVWYGEAAERAIRIGAVKVAHQLLKATARPPWALEISHVREGREAFLFRVKFFDWGGVGGKAGLGWVVDDGGDGGMSRCMVSFHKSVRTIATVTKGEESEVVGRALEALQERGLGDLPSPADLEVEAAGAGANDGHGKLLVWRVHPRGLVSVPEEEFGHMQSTLSYVLLFGYDSTG